MSTQIPSDLKCPSFLTDDISAMGIDEIVFPAVSLREGLQNLHAELKLVRKEIAACEGRILSETAKTREELAAKEMRLMREISNTQEALINTQETIILHLQVSLQQERIAELTRELEQMKSQPGRLGAATGIERS